MTRLLNEQRIKRFMTLAGNGRHVNKFLRENVGPEPVEETDELEEDLDFFLQEEDEIYEAAGDPMADDPMSDDPAGDAMGGAPDPADIGAGGDADLDPDAPEDDPMDVADDEEAPESEVDVTVDEEQLASLRTAIEVLQSIVEAGEGEEGEEGEEDALAGEEPPIEDMPPTGEEPPAPGPMAGGGGPPMPPGEEEPEGLAEARYLNELTAKVLKRVTRRLLKK
jgi:hypothetical protein